MLKFGSELRNGIRSPNIRTPVDIPNFQLVRQILDVYVSACVLAGKLILFFLLFYYTLANGFSGK